MLRGDSVVLMTGPLVLARGELLSRACAGRETSAKGPKHRVAGLGLRRAAGAVARGSGARDRRKRGRVAGEQAGSLAPRVARARSADASSLAPRFAVLAGRARRECAYQPPERALGVTQRARARGRAVHDRKPARGRARRRDTRL